MQVHIDQGHLENHEAALLELANVVEDYSEIELLQRQAKQIAREIVSRVRAKVSHSTTVVPASDEQLRQNKGIVIAVLMAAETRGNLAMAALLVAMDLRGLTI